MQATGQAAKPRTLISLLHAYLPILLLAAVGVLLMVLGSRYQVGTLTAMGPGFMPVLLGAILTALAGLLSWREAPLSQLPAPLRPLVCVVSGMLAWALLAERFGFFVAALAQILLTSLALPQRDRHKEVIVAVLLSIGAYLLFVRVLGLPLPAFGS